MSQPRYEAIRFAIKNLEWWNVYDRLRGRYLLAIYSSQSEAEHAATQLERDYRNQP